MTRSTTRPTVVLVEDDERTRERLASAIRAESRYDLVATASGVAEARTALEQAWPTILLTDLGLPDGDGVDLIRWLRSANAPTLPMVITVFGDEAHVVAALEAGALGYLLKDGSSEYLTASLDQLLDGGSPISPPIARSLLRRFREPKPAAPVASTDAPSLSDREQEVLTLIVKGFSYAEAARLMGISTHTVTTHVRNVYRKLEVHSRGEAVYEAMQLGLVNVKE